MSSPASNNPYLSDPDEDATCYACGESFTHGPTVVQGGSPAGQFLRLDRDQMVEVCNSCMKGIVDESIDDLPGLLKALSIDSEDSPAIDRSSESNE